MLGLNLYSPASPTLVERLLASLIIVAAAVPLVIWLGGRQPETPFLVFWGFVYAAYYAAPVFLLERFSRAYYLTAIIPDEYIEKALLLALLGVGAVLVGYYSPVQRVADRLVPRFRWQWEYYASRPAVLGKALGAAGLTAYVLNTVVGLPLWLQGLVSFLGDLSLLAIVYLFALQLVGVRGCAGFLWGVLVPLRFVLGVTTGSSYQGLLVVGALVLTYFTLRRRLPMGWLVAGVVIVAAVRGAQVPFREVSWQEGRSTMGLWERTVTMGNIVAQSVTGEGFAAETWQGGLSRASYLMTFAQVVQLTPNYVPFWKGETYRPLVWKLVPRAIVPEKPLETSGQEFGHRYGFLSPDDFVTSYNLPQLVEFYANFGAGGVAVGMLFLGVFYRLVQVAFVHPGAGLGACVAVNYVGLKLLLIESSLSSVVGGAVQAILFLCTVHMGLGILRRVVTPQRVTA